MGAFRLFLAVAVMLGHLSFYPHALPYMIPGEVAVEGFYIVSGFLITLVLTEKYAGRAALFYANRFLRLFPIYWCCLALYVIANAGVMQGWLPNTAYGDINFQNQSASWWWGEHPVNAVESAAFAFANLFIVGQDITRALGWHVPDYFYGHYIYVRVGWTIAVEIAFYAIAPLVVSNVRLVALLLAASFCAQLFAMTSFKENPAVYQLFPFELWCFMAGALAYHAYARLRQTLTYPIAATVIAFALTAGFNTFHVPRIGYLVAIAICLPGVVMLGRRNRLDSPLGDLSYPLYLIHPLGLIVTLPWTWSEPVVIAAVVLVSVLMVKLVERPAERIRKSLSNRLLIADPSLQRI